MRKIILYMEFFISWKFLKLMKIFGIQWFNNSIFQIGKKLHETERRIFSESGSPPAKFVDWHSYTAPLSLASTTNE